MEGSVAVMVPPLILTLDQRSATGASSPGLLITLFIQTLGSIFQVFISDLNIGRVTAPPATHR